MIKGIPKISVLVITYNQEDIIKRTIDSLLSQREYIYEICVSDDCSKDKTWDILQDYSVKNPGLFVLNRNEPNIGIFENVEKTFEMPSGDIIYQLAGDDECGEGWFKAVVEYIQKSNIDLKNERFCIYGDYKALYPNGDSYVHSNKLILSGYSPLKLSIRGLLRNRSACFSVNVLNTFKKVSKGKSYIAEASQDRQLQVFTAKNYYIPFVGNIYYARIGVSTSISGERWEQNLARWDYLLDNLKKWGVSIDLKDANYIHYRKAQQKGNYFNILKYGLSSIDWTIGLKGLRIKWIIFALLRRIPHKKPIKDFRI